MIFMFLTFCVFYQADDVLKLASLTNVVQVKAWTYYLEGRGGGINTQSNGVRHIFQTSYFNETGPKDLGQKSD